MPRYRYTGEIFAILKRDPSDTCYAIGNRYAGEAFATNKCSKPDTCYPLRNFNMRGSTSVLDDSGAGCIQLKPYRSRLLDAPLYVLFFNALSFNALCCNGRFAWYANHCAQQYQQYQRYQR